MKEEFDRFHHDTDTRAVHAYINALGGSAFAPKTPMNTAMGMTGLPPVQPPVIKAPAPYFQNKPVITKHAVVPINTGVGIHSSNPNIAKPPVIQQPAAPVVPLMPLPYFPYGGGGGSDASQQTQAQQSSPLLVVEPVKYYEKKFLSLKPMSRGLLESYPQAIINTKDYYTKRGVRYQRVLRFIEPNGDMVEATVYSNGRKRHIYVADFNVAEDQSALYDNADGDKAPEKKADKPAIKVSVPFIPASEKGRWAGMTVGVLIGLGYAFKKKQGAGAYFIAPVVFGLTGYVAGYALDKTILKKEK